MSEGRRRKRNDWPFQVFKVWRNKGGGGMTEPEDKTLENLASTVEIFVKAQLVLLLMDMLTKNEQERKE